MMRLAVLTTTKGKMTIANFTVGLVCLVLTIPAVLSNIEVGGHIGASANVLPDGPTPNQDCVTEKEVTIPNGTAVSGTGANAGEALNNALAAASGQVCKICDNGIQCVRSVVSSSGSITGNFVTNPDGTVTLTGTVNSYKVKIKCASC
jgi:hypothetical protein